MKSTVFNFGTHSRVAAGVILVRRGVALFTFAMAMAGVQVPIGFGLQDGCHYHGKSKQCNPSIGVVSSMTLEVGEGLVKQNINAWFCPASDIIVGHTRNASFLLAYNKRACFHTPATGRAADLVRGGVSLASLYTTQ